jgi:hypothetical protein
MLTDPTKDPAVRDLTVEAQGLVTLAGSYSVATAEQYQAAASDLKRVGGAIDRLEALRKSMTKPLDDAKKAIMDFFRGPSEQLERAKSQIKRSMIAFSDEQDRIRRAEQAVADTAARKERERIEAQARRALESGKTEKAEALEMRAATVVAPVIDRTPPKVVGVQTREVWKFEVTNAAIVPREYLTVDESKIRKVVGALKGDTLISGVRVWPEKSIAAASA